MKRKKFLPPLLLALLLTVSVLSPVAYAAETDSPSGDVPPVPDSIEETMQEVSCLEELLAAIASSKDGDTIVLSGTINIKQNCAIGDVEKSVTLIPSKDFQSGAFFSVWGFEEQDVTFQNLILDGQNTSLSAIEVNDLLTKVIVGEVSLSGIEVNNFNSNSRPVILSAVTAKVTDCTFSNNAGNRTAGIELSSNSNTVIENCIFHHNVSAGDGGAIRCMGQLELRNTTLSENQAGVEVDRPCTGGGLYIGEAGSGFITNSKITGNSANLGGGIATNGKLEIADSFICGNKGAMGASDIYAPNNTPLSITYTNGMNAIYTENAPVGYYADYFGNPFDPTNHTVFLGEGLSMDEADNLFGAKFIFSADLPREEEQEPLPPAEETPDAPDETPDIDLPAAPDEIPSMPERPDRPQTTPSRPSRPVHEDTPPVVIQPEETPALTLTFGGVTLDIETPLMLCGYGDGELHENDPITRAQIAELLYRALDEDSKAQLSTAKSSFADVSAGAWYYDSVSVLASAGVLQGYDGLYHPNDPLTLGQLITLITRFVEGKETNLPDDIQYAQHWAYPHIVTAAAYGWIENATEIAPDRPVTRGEAIEWINSVFEKCKNPL